MSNAKTARAIYDAAAASKYGFVDAADVSKLIRHRFKVAFPGVKCAVRTSKYSGGASIRVEWTDGPTAAQVREITAAYAGGGFDGMIDMAYSVDSFLMPDGSAFFAQTSGTEGSMGTVPSAKAFKPAPEAIRVRFLSTFVFDERRHSVEFLRGVLRAYSIEWRDDLGDAIDAGTVTVEDSTFGARIVGADSIWLGTMWGGAALHRFMVDREGAARAA